MNADIRIIVHRSDQAILLAYVDHHDAAYRWAERRKIERHPTTGAMQLVEIRERVEQLEIPLPRPVEPAAAKPAAAPKLFDNLRKFELMQFGVPEEWVDDVRAATDETLFDVIAHLPQEAQEALLKLAVGETPDVPQPIPADVNPYAHPDAQRRFRVLTNKLELEQALAAPWEKWSVFLHPSQGDLVRRKASGPVRVSGSAGTGKTIVAIHRAAHLARTNPEARVLLTTFSQTLARSLKAKLAFLVSHEPKVAERITVSSLGDAGIAFYQANIGAPKIAAEAEVRAILATAAREVGGTNFSPQFLFGEWTDVVDAWGLSSWDAYRDFVRLGRKTRLGVKQREALWRVFEQAKGALAADGLMTWSDLFNRLAQFLDSDTARPYDFAVVDEAQDLGVAEARFLAAMTAGRPEGLFLAGDLGQRIFQQPFSWKSLGLDVRGRSFTLRINYRTSHQIRQSADRLLPSVVTDVDGIAEGRKGTISVFDGPTPLVQTFKTSGDEEAAVAAWIKARVAEGCAPGAIGVFVRSANQLDRARRAVQIAGSRSVDFGAVEGDQDDAVVLGTMHLAKGLEFRSVVVMACDDEVIPLQERIESVSDEADLEEIYNTERHLLYVACTRARDHLLVTATNPASEFLSDLQG